MEIYEAIRSFFDMLDSYIELMKDYMIEANISEVLQYLFYCIPEEIRAVMFFFLFLILVLGIKNIFAGG